MGIWIQSLDRGDESAEHVNDTMKDTCLSRCALLAMTSILLVACQIPGPPTAKQTGDYNRMKRMHFPDIDSVYCKEDADLSAYAKVMVTTPTVALRHDWRPQEDPTLVGLGVPDPAMLRERVSQQFLRTLSTRLAENAGYAVGASAGPDVLHVKAAIKDLYFSSSALQTAAGSGEPYYMESSEITVAIELRDSTTGELLCLVTDHRASPNPRTVELNQGSWSSPGLRDASDHWASFVRGFLDQMRARTT
jgi:hypothetical protein